MAEIRRNGCKLIMLLREELEKPTKSRGHKRAFVSEAGRGDDGLLDALKATWTKEEFLAVSGVGEVKAARYGETFLRTISR